MVKMKNRNIYVYYIYSFLIVLISQEISPIPVVYKGSEKFQRSSLFASSDLPEKQDHNLRDTEPLVTLSIEVDEKLQTIVLLKGEDPLVKAYDFARKNAIGEEAALAIWNEFKRQMKDLEKQSEENIMTKDESGTFNPRIEKLQTEYGMSGSVQTKVIRDSSKSAPLKNSQSEPPGPSASQGGAGKQLFDVLVDGQKFQVEVGRDESPLYAAMIFARQHGMTMSQAQSIAETIQKKRQSTSDEAGGSAKQNIVNNSPDLQEASRSATLGHIPEKAGVERSNLSLEFEVSGELKTIQVNPDMDPLITAMTFARNNGLSLAEAKDLEHKIKDAIGDKAQQINQKMQTKHPEVPEQKLTTSKQPVRNTGLAGKNVGEQSHALRLTVDVDGIPTELVLMPDEEPITTALAFGRKYGLSYPDSKELAEKLKEMRRSKAPLPDFRETSSAPTDFEKEAHTTGTQTNPAEEPFLELQVEIDGRVEHISISEDENPVAVALRFAQKHNLSYGDRQILVDGLTAAFEDKKASMPDEENLMTNEGAPRHMSTPSSFSEPESSTNNAGATIAVQVDTPAGTKELRLEPGQDTFMAAMKFARMNGLSLQEAKDLAAQLEVAQGLKEEMPALGTVQSQDPQHPVSGNPSQHSGFGQPSSWQGSDGQRTESSPPKHVLAEGANPEWKKLWSPMDVKTKDSRQNNAGVLDPKFQATEGERSTDYNEVSASIMLGDEIYKIPCKEGEDPILTAINFAREHGLSLKEGQKIAEELKNLSCNKLPSAPNAAQNNRQSTASLTKGKEDTSLQDKLNLLHGEQRKGFSSPALASDSAVSAISQPSVLVRLSVTINEADQEIVLLQGKSVGKTAVEFGQRFDLDLEQTGLIANTLMENAPPGSFDDQKLIASVEVAFSSDIKTKLFWREGEDIMKVVADFCVKYQVSNEDGKQIMLELLRDMYVLASRADQDDDRQEVVKSADVPHNVPEASHESESLSGISPSFKEHKLFSDKAPSISEEIKPRTEDQHQHDTMPQFEGLKENEYFVNLTANGNPSPLYFSKGQNATEEARKWCLKHGDEKLTHLAFVEAEINITIEETDQRRRLEKYSSSINKVLAPEFKGQGIYTINMASGLPLVVEGGMTAMELATRWLKNQKMDVSEAPMIAGLIVEKYGDHILEVRKRAQMGPTLTEVWASLSYVHLLELIGLLGLVWMVWVNHKTWRKSRWQYFKKLQLTPEKKLQNEKASLKCFKETHPKQEYKPHPNSKAFMKGKPKKVAFNLPSNKKKLKKEKSRETDIIMVPEEQVSSKENGDGVSEQKLSEASLAPSIDAEPNKSLEMEESNEKKEDSEISIETFIETALQPVNEQEIFIKFAVLNNNGVVVGKSSSFNIDIHEACDLVRIMKSKKNMIEIMGLKWEVLSREDDSTFFKLKEGTGRIGAFKSKNQILVGEYVTSATKNDVKQQIQNLQTLLAKVK